MILIIISRSWFYAIMACVNATDSEHTVTTREDAKGLTTKFTTVSPLVFKDGASFWIQWVFENLTFSGQLPSKIFYVFAVCLFFRYHDDGSAAVKISSRPQSVHSPFFKKVNWWSFQIKGGVSHKWIPLTTHMRGEYPCPRGRIPRG